MPVVATALIAGYFSDHSEHVARSLPSFLIATLCLTGWTLALTAQERWRLLRGLVLPATLLSLLVILQFHNIFDPFTFERRLTDRLTLTSLAGGAFDLAGYLLLPLLVLQAWIRSAKGKVRVFVALALLICLYGMLVTQTLGAVAALVLASVVFWAPALPRRYLIFGAVGLVLTSSLLLFASPLRPRVVKKIQSLQRGELNQLLTGRLDGWRAAAHMVANHPVTGVGPGAFRAEFGTARLELTEAGVEFFQGQHHVFFINAHNDFLEALAEWGVLGGLALLWALWVFRRSHRIRGPTEGHVPEARSMELAACVGIGVLASTNFPFHVALIAYPWLLFFSGIPSGGSDTEPVETAESERFAGRGLALALAAIFLVALALRFNGAKNLLGADRLVAMVEGRSKALVAAGNRIPAQAIQQNIAMMKRAEVLDPASVSVPLILGGQYMLMKRYPAAIRSFERAIELEPRAEPYANLARCYLAQDQTEDAFAAIDKAIKLNHNQRRAFRSILMRERRHQKWREEQKGET